MHLIPVETLSTGSWTLIPGAMPHKLLTSFSVRYQSPAVPEVTNLPPTLLSFAWVTTTEDMKAQIWGGVVAILDCMQAAFVAWLTEVYEYQSFF